MQTVTFNKVFKEEGVSPKGRAWVRWDYKTADGGRFPHFAAEQEIPLDTAVNVQTSAKGDIKSFEVVGSPQQPVTSVAETGSDKPDWDQIGLQKTRCALVGRLLPAMFSALPLDDQGRESAELLLDWACEYVYSG